MSEELAGKVALVTGASRNIGRSIALDLASAGASVAVNARRSADEAKHVVAEIRDAGGTAEAFIADIADAAAVGAMVDGIVGTLGGLDLLVLNASERRTTPFVDMTHEEFTELISITIDGAFHCTKAVLPHMIAAGGGSIVTIGGMNSLSGAKGRVHGSVGKFGLYGFTRALAKELGEYRIRVNCVAPGQMNNDGEAGRSVAAKNVPLGRRVEYDDIAPAVRFLCGPGAAMISGQLLYVDGGQQQF